MPPVLPPNPTPKELYEAHRQGMVDWIFDLEAQREWDNFCSQQPDADDALTLIKDTHKAVGRALLYLSREKYDKGAFSQEAQTTGDCVSHGGRNAVDITRCVEIHIKNEPEEYFKRGATEPRYGCRGHGGQGMDPGRAAKFDRDYGFAVRQNYDGIVDLSKYNASIGTKWGRSGVPQAVLDICKQHPVGELIIPKTMEQSLDCFANGYACHSGQSWGCSSRQNSTGINTKDGAWNHDMGSGGYDQTLEIWKEPVVIVHNSWSDFNEVNPVWKAHQEVLGPWIPGTIIIPFDEWERYFLKSGSIYFYSGIEGFKRQTLPNYGTQTVLS